MSFAMLVKVLYRYIVKVDGRGVIQLTTIIAMHGLFRKIRAKSQEKIL